MKRRQIGMNVFLDTEIDAELGDWAEDEERSKRRHAAVLLRKLVKLKETNPDELRRLGLVAAGGED